jgi:hypothetical protein
MVRMEEREPTMTNTEIRRAYAAEIISEVASNDPVAEMARLKARFGEANVWDSSTLGEAFEVLEFQAPFVVVRRRSDQKLGSVEFQPHPRLYFNFQ